MRLAPKLSAAHPSNLLLQSPRAKRFGVVGWASLEGRKAEKEGRA
ncbi:MAG: hypothetical protein PUD47_09025 [Bacteroidales bacterium]|nr:hypothetical protein [Bacteroidales bacterium]